MTHAINCMVVQTHFQEKWKRLDFVGIAWIMLCSTIDNAAFPARITCRHGVN